MNLEELRKKLAALIEQSKAAEPKTGETQTEEQRAAQDKILAEIDAVSAEIDKAEADEKRAQKIKDAEARLQRPTGPKTDKIDPSAEPGIEKPWASARRDWKLRAFKGPNGDETAYKFGRWLRGSLFGSASDADWCKRHGIDTRAMGTVPNSAGGFTVPEQFATSIIDLREQYGVARREFGIVPMSSDTIVMPKLSSGTSAYYVGENAALTESQPVFTQVRLVAKKLAVLTRLSNSLNDDSFINLADWLAQEAAYQFAYQEDLAAFMGDSTSTYGGITGLFTAVNSVAGAYYDAAAGHDTFAEIDYDDLTNCMSKLPAARRANAKWYCSPSFKSAVFDNLSISAGGVTPKDVNAPAVGAFLGFPIVEVAAQGYVAGTTYNDVIVCCFGDARAAAYMGSRSDITLAVDASRYMEYDQLAVRAVERFDVVVHDYGTSSAAGAIVGLRGCTS